MSDPIENAFDEFATATELTLSRFADDVKAFKAELEAMKQEQRSAPALATQPTIDTDALVARAAALVPPPVIDTAEIVRQVVALIPAPEPGKDAVVDYDSITDKVRSMIAAEVAKIPAPTVDTDAIISGVVARIPVPKDGEDGAASPEEIRAIAREEVLTNQRDFYKGVFVEGQQYRTADAVTWDGSLWFAQRDTKLKPGDNNPDWKLGVKKGRDGRK